MGISAFVNNSGTTGFSLYALLLMCKKRINKI